MLTAIHPKLPMRDKTKTKVYYALLGFFELGDQQYDDYLMMQNDLIEIHFFKFIDLNPKENYGQVYIRTENIEGLYQAVLDKSIPVHHNGHLSIKAWGQKEFSLSDPDFNLLTFGQKMA
jgi:hypothetical protein